MKSPDLNALTGPIILPGTLEAYLATLTPWLAHGSSLAVFDATGARRFANAGSRYLLDDGSDSLGACYARQPLQASASFREGLNDCLHSGQDQALRLCVYFDRHIHVELTLQFRPLWSGDAVVGAQLGVGEEAFSFHRHYLGRLQHTLASYREQLQRVTLDKLKADGVVQALLRNAPFPMMLLNRQRQVMQINEACERLFGLASRQARAESCERFFDCYRIHQGCPLLDQDQAVSLEAGQCLAHPDTQTHILRSAVLLADTGEPMILEAFVDISDRVHAEQALQRAHAQNRLLLESTSEGIFGIDQAMRFTFINQAAVEIFGYSANTLLGRPLHEVLQVADEDEHPLAHEHLAIYETLKFGVKRRDDVVFVVHEGKPIPVQYSSSPVYEHGRVTGAVIVFRNVAESRALNKKMEYLATHDSLTGLVNRNEFERLVKAQIVAYRTQAQSAALSYIDLDQFKLVNDTCGHAAGDALLRQLTNVMQNTMRPDDLLARLGGDEFGILFRHVDLKQALALTQAVCKLIDEFRFIWEGKSFSIKASAGIALIDNDVEDSSTLLSAADAACYIAKERGRNMVHVYEHHDEAVTKRKSEMIWVTRLNEALLRNQFQLYYQPIFHHQDTGPCRFIEFLLRLHQPGYSEGDNVTLPGAFIPAAERYNLMPQVDRWVTQQVCDWIVKHNGSHPQLDLCAINLSGHTIGNSDFARFLEGQFRAHPNIARHLCFEITETAAVADLKRAIDFIEFIKGFGCQFALDDFGTGMSSFSYLKHLPVDFLKIDGTFVRDMSTDRVDFAMVEAINQVGHVMGIQTIAEYVESAVIVEQLDKVGVDYLQGNHLAEPQPLSSFSLTRLNLAQLPH